jgi:hypothetical protein
VASTPELINLHAATKAAGSADGHSESAICSWWLTSELTNAHFS